MAFRNEDDPYRQRRNHNSLDTDPMAPVQNQPRVFQIHGAAVKKGGVMETIEIVPNL